MQDQKAKELRALSASLIKTWETCSWLYYCKYVLKLPDPSNAGAKRGTICHKIFELLQDPANKAEFDLIVSLQNAEASELVKKIVVEMATKEGINEPEHMEMIYEMILIGLKFDFFLEGNEKLFPPEHRFDIVDPQGRFRVKGFIDQLAFFEDHAVIKDFKSSKAKFGKAELNPNLQNFIYSWAVWYLYKKLAKTRFVFLRFPKQPIQEPDQLTESELQGIEEYFTYVSSQIQDFDIKRAKRNFADRSFATKWLCGSATEGKWCCSYRKPMEYYALVDVEGNLKKTALKEEDLPKPENGEVVQVRYYAGCPRYN